MIDRNNCCGNDKCNSKLLAREGRFVFCLSCDWAIQRKRKDDEGIETAPEQKDNWA
jgi:hypothetical protein